MAVVVDSDLSRGRQAWEMRVQGATWDAIAQRLGYGDKSSAHRAVKAFRERSPHLEATGFRIELSERTEWLWAQASQDVMDGKPGAITAAVRVLDRWAKLTGSDAPTQIAVGHLDSMVAEMYASTDDRQLVLPSLPKLMPVQRER